MISHKMGLFLLFLCFFSGAANGEIIKDCEVVRQAKEYGAINPTLVLAVSHVESSNNSKVVSRQGHLVHYGLMQVQLGTARMLGFRGKPNDLLKWKTNLKYGVNYLNQKLEIYQSKEKAAAAYNAGSAFFCRKKCKVGNFVNQGYVNLVMRQYKKYNNLRCSLT